MTELLRVFVNGARRHACPPGATVLDAVRRGRRRRGRRGCAPARAPSPTAAASPSRRTTPRLRRLRLIRLVSARQRPTSERRRRMTRRHQLTCCAGSRRRSCTAISTARFVRRRCSNWRASSDKSRCRATTPTRCASTCGWTTRENLEDYLERFAMTLSVMQTAEALERIAYELAEDAAREGVRYLETRYRADAEHARGALAGRRRSRRRCADSRAPSASTASSARVIVCAIRNMAADGVARARRAGGGLQERRRGGLRSRRRRDRQSRRPHAHAFEYCAEHGLPCTCHAGEGDGADSIARRRCTPAMRHRIGHAHAPHRGSRARSSEVHDRRIAIEICLTSNVQTRATASLRHASAARATSTRA